MDGAGCIPAARPEPHSAVVSLLSLTHTTSHQMHELDAICHELQDEVRMLATKCVESEHAVTSAITEVPPRIHPHQEPLRGLSP